MADVNRILIQKVITGDEEYIKVEKLNALIDIVAEINNDIEELKQNSGNSKGN